MQWSALKEKKTFFKHFGPTSSNQNFTEIYRETVTSKDMGDIPFRIVFSHSLPQPS